MADAVQPTVKLTKPAPDDMLDATQRDHAAPPHSEASADADDRVGRFELIRELGRGGMGQVFLGRDATLGRRVAIKFLLDNDEHFLKRFLVEARATARCTHENIVTIFEVGEHRGQPYMVLEYLEGKTLAELIDEKRPSVREMVELMIPVARALERAHEHGIVHRDLKPSNIFVTDRGHVKVLDFGIARLIEHSTVSRPVTSQITVSDPTKTDGLLGTLPYMSPEQWGIDEIDHQTDLWAIGILFWRALLALHPAGTLGPALGAVLTDLDTPLPSLASEDPSIPREIVAVVDRCLQKRKRDRYQSATELVADLQAWLAPRPASEDVSPYRGLLAFGEADAAQFFGRANELRVALAQLSSWPLLAVIGPSGIGKSSFVHAGLVPAIRASGRWQVQILRPGRSPMHRLAAIAHEYAGDDLPTGRFADAPGMFGATLRAAATRHDQRVLVVVDQLEEVFTLCEHDAERRAFLTSLIAAADDPTSTVRVVLSMRADFLDRLAAHEPILAELTRGMFFLAAPDREALRETITRPAALAGYTFEDIRIVDDMLQAASSRGALPLVSFAAMRLWEARDRTRKVLTRSAYEQMGKVGGAFAQHADRVVAAVPPQNQQLLRAIVTRLVTADGTRAVVDHAELVSLHPDPAVVERILQQLIDARLVQMHSDDGGKTVEIVHEMLISEWPTLRRWLDDGHALRGFLEELGRGARQWAARGKPADLVWRGGLADDTLGHVRRHVLPLSTVEREFVTAIEITRRRLRRRKLIAFASVVATLLLVIALGAVALWRIKAAETEATNKAEQLALALEQTDQAQRHQRAAERVAVDASKAESLTRDQLVELNKNLAQNVRELGTANERAQAEERRARVEEQRAQASERRARDEEQRAKQASEQAKAAKREAERLLAEKQAELERLKKQMSEIINVDLTGRRR